MNALVVGTGSVGQVIARHLHLGGAKVTFLSRGHQGDAAAGRLVLYRLNGARARLNPIRFSSFEVITPQTRPNGRSWDQVYVCVPSDALGGELFAWIGEHCGDATVVKLQPGPGDRVRFASHVPDSRVVVGMLSLISYQAPLDGEDIAEPGMAYWFPPLMWSLFSGPGGRLRPVVTALKKGGIRARTHRDVETMVGYVQSVVIPLTLGYECAGWSISAFKQSRWMKVSLGAIREASAIVSANQRTSAPVLMSLIGPSTLRGALYSLPKVRAFSLEPYLRHHYTKLRAQSRQHLDDYIRFGREHGMDIPCLKELQEELEKGEAGTSISS